MKETRLRCLLLWLYPAGRTFGTHRQGDGQQRQGCVFKVTIKPQTGNVSANVLPRHERATKLFAEKRRAAWMARRAEDLLCQLVCPSQTKLKKGKLLKVGKLRSAEAGEKGSLVQAQV